MRELGAFFAADGVAPTADLVEETTGRVGTSRTANQRSTPGLFELEVAARPCRWPCNLHVHAEDLPANRVNRANHPAHEQPYLNSDPSEIRDA